MVLGNTLNILRPPNRSTPPIQTNWNEDLVKNLHKVLGEMSHQISTTATVSGASLTHFTTKSILEAATVPAIVESIQLSGYVTVGDGGGALYKRVDSEPSHALKIQSTDGAWWEIVPDVSITFQSSGGIEGDSAANGAANVTAFNDFIGYCQDVGAGAAFAASGPILFFPEGHYHFNAHLNIKAQVHLLGVAGWGRALRGGSTVEFPAEKNGFIVQRHNTIDLTTETSGIGGDASTIERLHILGGGNTGSVGSGVWMRASALVKDCFIEEFAEDGVRVLAGAGAGGALEGNANNWRIEGLVAEANGGNGIFVDGADVNVGNCWKADCINNGRWGVFDSSFLGDTYTATHTAQNGLATVGGNGAGESSLVHLAGTRYAANAAASEADYVATTPGTDETVWIDVGSGGSTSFVPTWLTSQSAGTYFHGGSFRADGAGARNLFLGNYSEDGMAPAQFVTPTIVMGGNMGAFEGTALIYDGLNITGHVRFQNHLRYSTPRDLELSINPAGSQFLKFKAGGDHSAGINILSWDEANGLLILYEHANLGSRRPMFITTDLSTGIKAGRASALTGGEVLFPKGIFIGGHINDIRQLSNKAAAPTTGEHAVGEIVFDLVPVSGAPMGWMCTVAGTPGTWVNMANLA